MQPALAHLHEWSSRCLLKPRRSTMSILTVLVTMSAWLAISNHCALGSAPPEAKAAVPNECPFHAQHHAPAKQKPASDSPCCKILRALPATPAKSFLVDLSFAAFIVVAPPIILFPSATLDTGPPGKTCFVELIPSMRAHAPPVRV